ncbi:hypothetical protein ACIGXM_01690 [Kitasatospora sp. NPDC052896]|uniref:hypothetical protein n=1 Tax=Kitasatospora sp. NPDC052896 TaxID=3364061 RepID=UPI0037CABE55
MQRTLGRAAAIAAGALIAVGIAAPAYAHVDAGGLGGGVASAHPVFLAGGHLGFADTSHIHLAGARGGWATSTAAGGGGGGMVSVDGWGH